MKCKWRVLPFIHEKCGKPGTILEVAGRADGMLVMGGVCVSCGEQFTAEPMSLATVIVSCALRDQRDNQEVDDAFDLQRWKPTGKVS